MESLLDEEHRKNADSESDEYRTFITGVDPHEDDELKSLVASQKKEIEELEQVNLNQTESLTALKSQRNEMQSEINAHIREVDILKLEKEKYKEIYHELKHTMQLEIEQAAMEKSHLKTSQMDLLRKLEKQQSGKKGTERRITELSSKVQTLTKQLSQAKDHIREQTRTVRKLHEASEKKDSQIRKLDEELIAAHAMNKERRASIVESDAKLDQAHGHVQNVEDKYRRLDNKYSALVENMKELRTYHRRLQGNHATATEELRQTKAALELSDRKATKYEHSSKVNADRYAQEKKMNHDMRSECKAAFSEREKTSKQVLERERVIGMLQEKIENLNQKNQEIMQDRYEERKQVLTLQARLAKREEEVASANRKLHQMNESQNKLHMLVEKREKELETWESKKDYYLKLQKNLAEQLKCDKEHHIMTSSSSSNQLKLDESTDGGQKQKNSSGSSNEESKKELQGKMWAKMLRSSEGQVVSSTLNRLRVDPMSVRDWYAHPVLFVTALYDLFEKMKSQQQIVPVSISQLSRGGGSSNGNGTKLSQETDKRLDKAKTNQLLARLQASEANTTKSVLRLIEAVTRKREENNPNFIDIDISEFRLEDSEIMQLVRGLENNPTCGVRGIDLHQNRVCNETLLRLVQCALHPESSIEEINLQQNRITVDGVKNVAELLSSMTRQEKADDEDDEENTSENEEQEQEDTSNGELKKGTVLSAKLKSQSEQLIPIFIVEIFQGKGKAKRTISIDLRYNTLQHGQTKQSMKTAMRKILISLQQVSNQYDDNDDASFESDKETSDDGNNMPSARGEERNTIAVSPDYSIHSLTIKSKSSSKKKMNKSQSHAQVKRTSKKSSQGPQSFTSQNTLNSVYGHPLSQSKSSKTLTRRS